MADDLNSSPGRGIDKDPKGHVAKSTARVIAILKKGEKKQ